MIRWTLLLTSLLTWANLNAQTECGPHPAGMIITEAEYIKDCGTICFVEGLDSLCTGMTVDFTHSDYACGVLIPDCTLEFMMVLSGPGGAYIETGWTDNPVVTRTFNTPGTWNVRMCARGKISLRGFCETSIVPIIVKGRNAAPEVDDIVCIPEKGSNVLSNPITGFEYNWSFGPNTEPMVFQGPNPPKIKYSNAGPYTTILEAKFGRHCTESFSGNVDVEDVDVYLGSDRSVCLLDTLNLCDFRSNTNGTYVWSTGEQGRCIDYVPKNPVENINLSFISNLGCSDNDDVRLYPDTCAKIGDYVWLDEGDGANAQNGIQDGDESGVSGILVQLYSQFGGLVSSTVTNSKGYYSFCVKPGSYYLSFGKRSGYLPTIPHAGSNPELDSDVTGSQGVRTTGVFAVSNADTLLRFDALSG